MGPVVAIVGPTASGKSDIAQAVALQLNGEVVSADSMQIYRGMDIGTAKMPVSQRKVVHHLIDILEPGEAYSAQLFQTQAREAFKLISHKGKVPVLCGGTGFYVQAALEDMRFPKGEQLENPLRQKYEAYLKENGALELWKLLESKDSASAAVIHPNNSRRVIRALEMAEEGVSYAEQSKHIKELAEVVPSIRFVLNRNTDELVRRIDRRVDAMIATGLVEEVQTLRDSGFTEALTAPQAIGYKEIVAALEGECTLDEAIEQIKIATRRYAKRQRSWFRRDKTLIQVDMDTLTPDEATHFIIESFHERFNR